MLRHFFRLSLVVATRAAWPRFAWDTLPVYVHMCNRTGTTAAPFSDDALAFLARFPMVTVEKGQGEDANETGTFAEDRILAAARAVKAAAPASHTLFYYNSVLNWEMYAMGAAFDARPAWWLRDAAGAPVREPGDHDFPQPSEGMLIFDFAQPDVRAWWASACLNLTATGAVDGCFSDRAGQEGFPGVELDPDAAAAYAAGHDAVHQELQAALPGGVLVANGKDIDGVRGRMLEDFAANEESIEELRACAATGRVCQAHAGYKGAENATGCADITDALAAFLIGAGERSYWGCSTDTGSDGAWYYDAWHRWNPEYDLPLGAPTANSTKRGDLWTRAFASGTAVTFNVTSNKGAIAWAAAN